MKTIGKMTTLAAAMLLGSSVQASLIATVADGDTIAYVIPPSNNYAPMVGISGEIGATVVATGATPINLKFEYLFKEAGYVNKFRYSASDIFTTGTTAFGATYSTIWGGGAGPLPFEFLVTNTSTTITNTAAGNVGGAVATFFTHWDGVSDWILIALDDSGAGPDDNHDDMIIKVTASKVPEPSTLGLLALGILGTGLAARKRYQKGG